MFSISVDEYSWMTYSWIIDPNYVIDRNDFTVLVEENVKKMYLSMVSMVYHADKNNAIVCITRPYHTASEHSMALSL